METILAKTTLKLSDYKMFIDNNLPESALAFAEENGVFKYGGSWIEAFYKGDIKTTKDWIIVSDNGCFYKVGAEFMIWKTGMSRAVWSFGSLKKMLKQAVLDQTISRDPDYQT